MAWKFVISLFGFTIIDFELARVNLDDSGESAVALGTVTELADDEGDVPYGFAQR